MIIFIEKVRWDTTRTGRANYDALLKNKNYDVKLTKMSPKEFLDLADARRYLFDPKISNSYKTAKTLPTPILIWSYPLKPNEATASFVDGIHRVSAMLGVEKEIPVFIAVEKS